MTPDERKEAVAMLRQDAAAAKWMTRYLAQIADARGSENEAARANLLTLVADELARGDAEDPANG